MTASLRRAAIAISSSICAGLPRICTAMMARVRGVIFRSTSAGSSVSVSSTSAMTGMALHVAMTAAEARKV